ncbi:MAG: hypothetical protein R3C59_23250 [Planctomycetaceae bacterium]
MASVVDDGSSTHLADYSYLGLQTAWKPITPNRMLNTHWWARPEAMTRRRETSTGLDRFGRIDDSYWAATVRRSMWIVSSTAMTAPAVGCGGENVVARSLSKFFDEKYLYDEIHRLQDMERGGELNSGHTSISNKTFAQDWLWMKTATGKGFKQDDNGNGTWDLNQSRTSNDVNEITDITETAGSSWVVTPAYSAAGNMTTMPQPATPTNSLHGDVRRMEPAGEDRGRLGHHVRIPVRQDQTPHRAERVHLRDARSNPASVLHRTIQMAGRGRAHRFLHHRPRPPVCVGTALHIDDLILRDRDTTGNGTLDERLYALTDANWNVTS